MNSTSGDSMLVEYPTSTPMSSTVPSTSGDTASEPDSDRGQWNPSTDSPYRDVEQLQDSLLHPGAVLVSQIPGQNVRVSIEMEDLQLTETDSEPDPFESDHEDYPQMRDTLEMTEIFTHVIPAQRVNTQQAQDDIQVDEIPLSDDVHKEPGPSVRQRSKSVDHDDTKRAAILYNIETHIEIKAPKRKWRKYKSMAYKYFSKERKKAMMKRSQSEKSLNVDDENEGREEGEVEPRIYRSISTYSLGDNTDAESTPSLSRPISFERVDIIRYGSTGHMVDCDEGGDNDLSWTEGMVDRQGVGMDDTDLTTPGLDTQHQAISVDNLPLDDTASPRSEPERKERRWSSSLMVYNINPEEADMEQAEHRWWEEKSEDQDMSETDSEQGASARGGVQYYANMVTDEIFDDALGRFNLQDKSLDLVEQKLQGKRKMDDPLATGDSKLSKLAPDPESFTTLPPGVTEFASKVIKELISSFVTDIDDLGYEDCEEEALDVLPSEEEDEGIDVRAETPQLDPTPHQVALFADTTMKNIILGAISDIINQSQHTKTSQPSVDTRRMSGYVGRRLPQGPLDQEDTTSVTSSLATTSNDEGNVTMMSPERRQSEGESLYPMAADSYSVESGEEDGDEDEGEWEGASPDEELLNLQTDSLGNCIHGPEGSGLKSQSMPRQLSLMEELATADGGELTESLTDVSPCTLTPETDLLPTLELDNGTSYSQSQTQPQQTPVQLHVIPHYDTESDEEIVSHEPQPDVDHLVMIPDSINTDDNTQISIEEPEPPEPVLPLETQSPQTETTLIPIQPHSPEAIMPVETQPSETETRLSPLQSESPEPIKKSPKTTPPPVSQPVSQQSMFDYHVMANSVVQDMMSSAYSHLEEIRVYDSPASVDHTPQPTVWGYLDHMRHGTDGVLPQIQEVPSDDSLPLSEAEQEYKPTVSDQGQDSIPHCTAEYETTDVVDKEIGNAFETAEVISGNVAEYIVTEAVIQSDGSEGRNIENNIGKVDATITYDNPVSDGSDPRVLETNNMQDLQLQNIMVEKEIDSTETSKPSDIVMDSDPDQIHLYKSLSPLTVSDNITCEEGSPTDHSIPVESPPTAPDHSPSGDQGVDTGQPVVVHEPVAWPQAVHMSQAVCEMDIEGDMLDPALNVSDVDIVWDATTTTPTTSQPSTPQKGTAFTISMSDETPRRSKTPKKDMGSQKHKTPTPKTQTPGKTTPPSKWRKGPLIEQEVFMIANDEPSMKTETPGPETTTTSEQSRSSKVKTSVAFIMDGKGIFELKDSCVDVEVEKETPASPVALFPLSRQDSLDDISESVFDENTDNSSQQAPVTSSAITTEQPATEENKLSSEPLTEPTVEEIVRITESQPSEDSKEDMTTEVINVTERPIENVGDEFEVVTAISESASDPGQAHVTPKQERQGSVSNESGSGVPSARSRSSTNSSSMKESSPSTSTNRDTSITQDIVISIPPDNTCVYQTQPTLRDIPAQGSGDSIGIEDMRSVSDVEGRSYDTVKSPVERMFSPHGTTEYVCPSEEQVSQLPGETSTDHVERYFKSVEVKPSMELPRVLSEVEGPTDSSVNVSIESDTLPDTGTTGRDSPGDRQFKVNLAGEVFRPIKLMSGGSQLYGQSPGVPQLVETSEDKLKHATMDKGYDSVSDVSSLTTSSNTGVSSTGGASSSGSIDVTYDPEPQGASAPPPVFLSLDSPSTSILVNQERQTMYGPGAGPHSPHTPSRRTASAENLLPTFIAIDKKPRPKSGSRAESPGTPGTKPKVKRRTHHVSTQRSPRPLSQQFEPPTPQAEVRQRSSSLSEADSPQS